MSNPLLQATVPVGTIMAFALNAPLPAGWLLCDGMPVDKAVFPALGMFMNNTPNLCGRTLIGAGSIPGNMYMPGQTGGEETHILTEAEMPEHTHNLDLPQGDKD